VRLIIKNLCKKMPVGVVLEELGSMGIRVQRVMQLRSGRLYQKPAKGRPHTPNFIVSVIEPGGV
jgi:hypothetical protein